MSNPVHRRHFLKVGAASLALCSLPLRADRGGITHSLSREFPEQPIQTGKVHLKLPAFSENGSSVALTVDIDSPMTPNDYVESIYLFSDKNPLPDVARYQLSPANGIARIATRIRLADSQTIAAVARMNDQSLWLGSADIVVTIAACVNLS